MIYKIKTLVIIIDSQVFLSFYLEIICYKHFIFLIFPLIFSVNFSYNQRYNIFLHKHLDKCDEISIFSIGILSDGYDT